MPGDTTSPSSPDHRGALRSQVSLRTVFTVAGGVLGVAAVVYFITRTQVAITLSLLGAMIAVALNHVISLLTRLGLSRNLAILTLGFLSVVVGALLAFILIPPAVSQVQVLIHDFPQLVDKVRQSQAFRMLDRRFQLSASIEHIGQDAPAWIFAAFNEVVGIAAAGVTVFFLAIFMLIFGQPLLASIVDHAVAHRARIQAVLDNIYHAIGGYVAGLALICTINSVLTAAFLAILGMPFFLPLAVVSGFSSLVPYVGSLFTSVAISVLALVAKSSWHALAVVIWFTTYGQIEGNILSPIIFRRTVHVSPLVTLLSILFLGEIAGIVGAIVAIPVVAALQIILREVLRARREAFGGAEPVSPGSAVRDISPPP